MKKFLSLFVIVVCFLASSVQAKTIKVEALQDFTTVNPAPTFRIKTLEPEELPFDTFLPKNTVISGILLKANAPQIGKRNSYIELIPTEMSYKEKVIPLRNSKLTAVIVAYAPLSNKEIAVNVARKTANIFLRGLISVVEFVQGAAKAKDGERVKSGVLNAYEDSFFSYIEPGKDLNIHKGDTVYLKIKKIR